MTGFAALHLVVSMLSERIEGRWKEVSLWVSALEFAGWFIAYAATVPILGYLPSTLIFAAALTLRAGFRTPLALMSAAASALVIVLLFKTFLQVKLPAGQVYEVLPAGLRQIMLTYF